MLQIGIIVQCLGYSRRYRAMEVDMVPIVGTARVIGTGFDTDRMLRWVDFEFSPQWYDLKVKRVFYSAVSVDDIPPIPMSDKMERDFFVRYLRRIGYELDE